ncbi:hypothetical protein [Methylobacterium dankookense]|uniref:Uncharacterized protein n=1 Tax=Methylobacterium dankookense TaxID=560405 RepID=A0A564G228_9HYPH|nr:hypothetical protein [Methylobacterium dankookense]GJD58836.1 hypothetical protein IFDJLNFL_4762 [Methylobacterium dankookense]VUF14192.1 hypothetical protein MTDSW087_03908 [Methylobacterium dankookense]
MVDRSHPNGVYPGPRNARIQLARIAAALGRPVEELTLDSGDRDDLTGAAELLSLWFAIADADARAEVLAVARAAAAER